MAIADEHAVSHFSGLTAANYAKRVQISPLTRVFSRAIFNFKFCQGAESFLSKILEQGQVRILANDVEPTVSHANPWATPIALTDFFLNGAGAVNTAGK
jgi:hypothetical protein